jgi:hypothetical protein
MAEENKKAEAVNEEPQKGSGELTPEEQIEYWKGKATRITDEFNSEKQKRQELEAQFKKDKVEIPNDSTGFGKLGKEDLIALILNSQEKYEALDNKYTSITKQQERTQKLNVAKQVFKEYGNIKDNYLDALDTFIDIDKIDPDNLTSIKLQVKDTREKFPDLFKANGSYSKVAPAPGRLESSDSVSMDSLKKEYTQLLNDNKLTQSEKLIKMTENLSLQAEIEEKSRKRRF